MAESGRRTDVQGGPKVQRDRASRRFRAGLPAKRVRPSVAGVLDDAVALAKSEIDILASKSRAGGGLSGADVVRLKTLIDALSVAQRTEERVEAGLREQLAGMDEADLAEMAGEGKDQEMTTSRSLVDRGSE